MVELNENNVTLIVAASVLGLVGYLQIVRRRQHVAVMELALAVGFVFFLIPKGAFFSYVNARDGTAPNTVLQLMVACLVSHCACLHFTKYTENLEVSLCTTVTNILTRSSLALCSVQGMIYVKSLSNVWCLVSLAVLIPLIIGDLFHVFHMKIKYSGTVGDPISWYLTNDAMLTFVLGMLVLTFPNIFGKKPDEATKLFVKGLGFIIICHGLLSLSGVCFRDEQDATSLLKSKVLMYVLWCAAGASSYVTDSAFWTESHPYCLVFISGMLLYNAIHIFIDKATS